MIDKFRNLFTKPKPKAIIPQRSHKNGESLTEYESDFIYNKKTCPDCEIGKLIEGPSGGLSINHLCNTCRSEFNVSPLFIERISDVGCCSKDRCKHLYGIID